MTYISTLNGYIVLLTFGIIMLLVTWLLSKRHEANNSEDFILASRKLGWIGGAISIAASWIWAPALFVSTQFAYQKGLAGAFWFIVPNILALWLFALIAPRIREKFPEGVTMPQYIKKRFNSTRLHKLYLFPYFFYQLMAVAVQLFAGGSLVALLTGIPLTTVMPLLLAIALAYTLISGLKASVYTDIVQMVLIYTIGATVIATTLKAAGGIEAVKAGLQGIEGIEKIYDGKVAFSFGIVTAIGLFAGAIADQQYWQRAFAIKKDHLKRAFILGGILFGMVPIALSCLGFLAANPALAISLPDGVDASMIGVQTVSSLLPPVMTFLFVIMLLAGLSSTLDSGLSAASSLWVTDVSKHELEAKRIKSARISMIGIGLSGLIVGLAANFIPSFGLQHLWWIFNTIAACIAVPTIMSLYEVKMSEKGTYIGILAAFIIGIPLFVYANILGNTTYIVLASLFVIIVSTCFSLLRIKAH